MRRSRCTLLLLCAASRAEWVEWPAGQDVPDGAATRMNVATNQVEVDVDVNATLMEHRWRMSVDEATRAEDTTANLTKREAIISALKRLPPDEVGEVDGLTDDELDALWADRQVSLREWSERLSDAAKSLQNRLAALLQDDHQEKLDALDELCVSPRPHRAGVALMAYIMLTFDSHAGTLSSPISTRPKTSTTRWAAGQRSRGCSRRTRRRSVDGRRSASGRRRNTAFSTGCSRRKCSRAWWPCSTK